MTEVQYDELNAKTEELAKIEIIELSKINSNNYIYAYESFGFRVNIYKYLDIHSPTESCFDWYVLNGKVKQFTNAQKIANENCYCISCI